MSDVEYDDSQRVDAAIKAIQAGEAEFAEATLQSVVQATPEGWRHVTEDADGRLAIRFWDQSQFMHYVTWMKAHSAIQPLDWIPNAYSRAHYYLGFLSVRLGRFDEAIERLQSGRRLEPTNPLFAFEMGHALVRLRRLEEAKAVYEEVDCIGPFVSGRQLAMAKRGQGFVAIEAGGLDEAEANFRESLIYDPGNSVALNELEYVAQLRRGDNVSEGFESVTSGGGVPVCAACGEAVAGGIVVSYNGSPHLICDPCRRTSARRWWQFWK